MKNIKEALYKVYLLKLNPGLGFESGFNYRKHAFYHVISVFVELRKIWIFFVELGSFCAFHLARLFAPFKFNFRLASAIFAGFMLCSPMVSAIHDKIQIKTMKLLRRSDETVKNYDTYDKIIERAAGQYNLDPTLIKSIIMSESEFNPKCVSSAGACGLMQLMPETARLLGVKDIFNPFENIMAGTRFFSSMLDEFRGNLKLALAAYNAGPNVVHYYKNKVPPFKETKLYLKKIERNYRKFALVNSENL